MSKSFQPMKSQKRDVLLKKLENNILKKESSRQPKKQDKNKQ